MYVHKGGVSDVFVNKPEDAEIALVNNQELCTLEGYSKWFYSPASRVVN